MSPLVCLCVGVHHYGHFRLVIGRAGDTPQPVAAEAEDDGEQDEDGDDGSDEDLAAPVVKGVARPLAPHQKMRVVQKLLAAKATDITRSSGGVFDTATQKGGNARLLDEANVSPWESSPPHCCMYTVVELFCVCVCVFGHVFV